MGGRVWSLRGAFPEGQICELGGELIDTGHETLLGLCGELGLELDDFELDDPALARDVWYFGGRRVSDAEVVAAFRPVAARMDAAWGEIEGEVITYRQPSGGEAIDRMTMADWLRQAGAEGWFYDLLDVGYTTEYGLEISEQSPWNLLMLIDTQPDPFRIFGDSDERFHVRGGNDLVPTALARLLGDRIETETRLEAISQTADGGYRLAVDHAGSARELAADRVVLTIPFTLLREVCIDLPLPEVKVRAIAELGYGTNAKLMVGFAERIWRTRGRSDGSVLTDLPFQLSWESTRLQSGQGGILVGYTGEARFHWPSFRWTRGSYACYRPGQWTSIAGAESEAVGNLHFAGEHTSYDFQGYMEGGAESGTRAAREVLTGLGVPVPPALRSAGMRHVDPRATSLRDTVRAALA